MRSALILGQMLFAISTCWAQSFRSDDARKEAEYYVIAYSHHYRVPVAFVRAIVDRESNWQPCTVSAKGAVGLMQLIPPTARRFGVTNRCDLNQNVAGGMRYLAWLIQQFHSDLRLVAAAYYVGEGRIGRRGLAYRNSDVLAYVSRIRTTYLREATIGPESKNIIEKRDVR